MPAVPRTINLPNTDDFRPFDLAEVANRFDHRLRTGQLESYRPAPLGFPQIDACLGGGARAEDLILIGGMQNVGKTILALETARNQAVAGQVLPIVVCYEHSPEVLFHRLLCQESIEDPDDLEPTGVTRAEIERVVLDYYDAHPAAADRQKLDLVWLFKNLPLTQQAWSRMSSYLWNMWLVRGDGLETTIRYLDEYVRMARAMDFQRVMLIVDYAQRVPLDPTLAHLGFTEAQRIDLVMRGLKGIGMKHNIPVVAVAAADAEGLRQQRIHVENLWGPATVQYEPDAALIINRDSADAEGHGKIVRVGIEKNRNGPSEVEFRHHLHGAYYCLSRTGTLVPAEESYQTERIGLRESQQATARPGLDPFVAMLFLLASNHSLNGQRGELLPLFRRALQSEDGGVGMLDEIAERLGVSEMLEK